MHGITLKLDYLQSQLHVDALRLHSICEANNYLENYLDIVNASSIDPHLGDTTQLYYLLTSLEKRNMSLVLDIHINKGVKTFGVKDLSRANINLINRIYKKA